MRNEILISKSSLIKKIFDPKIYMFFCMMQGKIKSLIKIFVLTSFNL